MFAFTKNNPIIGIILYTTSYSHTSYTLTFYIRSHWNGHSIQYMVVQSDLTLEEFRLAGEKTFDIHFRHLEMSLREFLNKSQLDWILWVNQIPTWIWKKKMLIFNHYARLIRLHNILYSTEHSVTLLTGQMRTNNSDGSILFQTLS